MDNAKDSTRIAERFGPDENIVLHPGDCLKLLADVPDGSVQLVVTSPPYNIGKSYERRLSLASYLKQQAQVIRECVRILRSEGSICWQVGNYLEDSAIVPLDSVLYPIFRESGLSLRNRIIWHFEHGLHCKKRFSGRYETINWFTKTDDYVFNLDSVRVPQKYPGKKHFKGPKAGQYSGNPLGKNPGDLWAIPNVKSNHVEKTDHPCQFPVELVERLVLALTNPDQWVLDPFVGVGTSIVAAIRHGRKGAGAEIVPEYLAIAASRIESQLRGALRTRPMHRPVYDPLAVGNSLTRAPWAQPAQDERQLRLVEQPRAEFERE
jgi:adenine-specific DNA-methyltransferase